MSTTSHSQQSSMSRSPSQGACMDPLDLVDFSEYEQMSYQSPSLSPSTASKSQFVRPVASTPTANNALLSSSQQTMSGPSHNYDMYKQQTGIPSGALASTIALNPGNMYNSYGYMSGTGEDFLDFSQPPNSFEGLPGVDNGMDFESPTATPAFFYPEHSLASSSEYVNPSAIGGQEVVAPTTVLPTQSNVGRLWPGMHQQQAALAKAQQQQKQQQALIQQQRQQSMAAQSKNQRPKSHQASDPLVEEKISQLLNSMRQSSVSTSDEHNDNTSMSQVHRMRKEEEDMDEDERLLASEEGKKLSSKERRQLRNKVSARAFRSRRKEYIGQLEGEIAQKVNENTDLRMRNRALMEENTRLSDLTRMLLSSPSFSGFLDTLTPAQAAPQPQQQQIQAAPAQPQQVRKDVNPYTAQAQLNQNNQRINMTLIPEQTMDFSMLDINASDYAYQPQVFSVLELPEAPVDISVLSGKKSNFVDESFVSSEEKVEVPVIERPAAAAVVEEKTEDVADEAFDTEFPLFSQPSHTVATSVSSPIEIDLSAISEKATPRFELVIISSTPSSESNLAMARVERLCAKLDPVLERLEALTLNL